MMGWAGRALLWTAKPRVQVWFNGIFTIFWLIFLPVTLLEAHSFIATVIWVSFISAWALFATHLGAWIAALVNVRAEEIQSVASLQTLERILHSQDAMLAELHALAIDTSETIEDIEEHFATESYNDIMEKLKQAGYSEPT